MKLPSFTYDIHAQKEKCLPQGDSDEMISEGKSFLSFSFVTLKICPSRTTTLWFSDVAQREAAKENSKDEGRLAFSKRYSTNV